VPLLLLEVFLKHFVALFGGDRSAAPSRLPLPSWQGFMAPGLESVCREPHTNLSLNRFAVRPWTLIKYPDAQDLVAFGAALLVRKVLRGVRQPAQEASVILEVAILNVRLSMEADFEAAFSTRPSSPDAGLHLSSGSTIIEVRNRYILLVNWETIEAHTLGFRGSHEYQDWKRLLHHFYDPFPTVEHYEIPFSGEREFDGRTR
jgi:heme-degrading monooxygenase HmoA